MKFEIDIPDKLIQDKLNELIRVDGSGFTSFNLRSIIYDAVKKAVADKIREQLPAGVSRQINQMADEELRKAGAQKVPGWAKRRVKEALENIRRNAI